MSRLSFHYRAIDQSGRSARGTLYAENLHDAYRRIIASGLKPLDIRVARSWLAGLGLRRAKVTLKDLAHFTHQFAVLMEARIPIVDGLRSIAGQESNARLREVIEEVARSVAGGTSVTDALQPHQQLFGEVYVETVRAAEQSGNLIEVLNHLAGMLEQRYEIGREVRSAMLYPICVVSAMVLALVFLMIFVVPRFAEMFATRGVDLPAPTQVLISASDALRMYWYIWAGALVGVIHAIRVAWRNPAGRRRIDNWLHMVPLLREVLRGLAISRFAAVLGIGLRSGIGLIDALEMSGKASGRPLLRADVQRMLEQVNQGGRLADVLRVCDYFPPFTRRMLAAGEEAAELARMCKVVARHYERDVSHLTRNVTTLIEPLLIAGLTVVVLVIAIAIFLPLWEMAALIG